MNDQTEKSTAHEERLNELLAHYLSQMDLGQAIDREAFLREHADLAEELDELLQTADQVQRMAGSRLMEEQAEESPAEGQWLSETVSLSPTSEASPAGSGQGACEVHRASADLHGPELVGQAFGDYELLEPLGRGGMGVVYKARQSGLKRLVAVKMILAGRFASDEDVVRFYNEAQAAGKLAHPHIVRVHQVDKSQGYHFYSMDYIEGTTLAQLAGGGPLSPAQAVRYVRQIAQAVHHAHENGILHRDLKPANVLIDSQDRAHVTDFGLAKNLHEEASYTASGTALGTISYMAPEQAAGKRAEISRSSDIYSLGVILYELLTGRPPFRCETGAATLLQVLHDEPPHPRSLNPQIGHDLEVICLKCLHKDPQQRYTTAEELDEDLKRLLEGRPIQAKPVPHLVRARNWVAGIPVIDVLRGSRTMQQPTRWQMRAQWMMLATLLVALLAWGAWASWPAANFSFSPTPIDSLGKVVLGFSQIRIATADERGMYHKLWAALQSAIKDHVDCPVGGFPTKGSAENLELLSEGKLEAAFLQASLFDDRVALVAPLYYEPSFILARRDRDDIGSIEDLRGKNVALGEEGSGMLPTAKAFLDHYGVSLEDLGPNWDRHFTALKTDSSLDAALVTTELNNPALQELLKSGQYNVVGIDDQELANGPLNRPFRIEQKHLPDEAPLGEEGVQTVAALAFLVVHKDAPDRLVWVLLKALYDKPDLVSEFELLEPQTVAQWGGLPWHGAAEQFFEAQGFAP